MDNIAPLKKRGFFAFSGSFQLEGYYYNQKEGFQKKEKDILLRLTFKLRDSVQSGEIYNITIQDAVMATIDNSIHNSSLATSSRTLSAYLGKIIVK